MNTTEDSGDDAGNAGPLDGGRNLLPAEFSLPAFMDSSNERGLTAGLTPRNRNSTSDIAQSDGTRASSHFGNEMNLVGSRESGIRLTGAAHEERIPHGSQAEPAAGAGNAAVDRSDDPLAPSRPFPPDTKEQAYCQYCQIYKPWRSHHCRVCGVCVLGME